MRLERKRVHPDSPTMQSIETKVDMGSLTDWRRVAPQFRYRESGISVKRDL